jgi:tripartite-type tricarboxylate transporter receptor subunit TctC
MILSRRTFLALAVAVSTSRAAAQAYPTKPIRLIVPFPPGGGTDILARVLGNRLSQTFGQPVVVENKPGAGGNIGVDAVAKAAPDGYTLVLGQTSNLAINPTLYPRLPYDPLKDLAPIALVASAPLVLVVQSGSPYRSLADIVTAAKAKPDTITFASPGSGTVAHLTGELLQREAGLKFKHVPYKGAAQAITDLLGRTVDLYMSSVPTALTHIKGGRLRPFVVTSAKRVPELPDVPTVVEAGYPGTEAATWFGLLARAGTPSSVITRLAEETNRALETQEVREKIAAEGAEVLRGSPEEFATLLRAEIDRWGRVVRESGARVE